MRFELRRRRRVYEKCSFFFTLFSLSPSALSLFWVTTFSLSGKWRSMSAAGSNEANARGGFWMRTVPSNIILWERRARAVASVLLRAVFASRRNFHHQKERGTNEPENLKKERGVVALSKKRERENKFSFRTNPIAASRAKILTSFSSPWCSDIEQFNKKSPGSPSPPRRRPSTKSVSQTPHLREKNQPGTPSSKSAAPNNSSPRADTTAPLLTGRGTRVQGGF